MKINPLVVGGNAHTSALIENEPYARKYDSSGVRHSIIKYFILK